MNAPPPSAAAPGVAPAPTPARSDDRLLLVCMALYAVLFLAFFPRLYTSIDEASTFRMADVLRHGSLFTHDDGFFPSISPPGPHGRLYRFPIGFPALLAPLSGLGRYAPFLLNPLLHLLATWLFARVLRAARIPGGYAVLFLLYPPFVLFDRTLFSDGFAAFLTTAALFLLLQGRGGALGAGLCLGLALSARAASAPVAALLFLAVLVADRRDGRLLFGGRAPALALGLLPFVLGNGWYNAVTMGSPFRSPYSAGQLSLHGVAAIGPWYAASLLILLPGMLLAPFLYRGLFWKTGLAATTLVTLLAAAYNESTFGNNPLQTLLSTPRQVLPVMPFYLLAYCGVLARWLPETPLRRARAFPVAAALLLLLAGAVSYTHQKYLRSLALIQDRVGSALPARCAVYANKDAYKLHQPAWDGGRLYRELPFVSVAQGAADLRAGPVFVVLFVRSRGFGAEDADNAVVLQNLHARFRLAPGPSLGDDGQLQCERVVGVR